MKNIKYISRFLYLVIVFCLILATTGNSVALAANDKVSGPAITYTEAKNAISFSGTGANNSDLFPKFKGLVPGDSVTQTITLISDKTNTNNCTFSMKAANSDKKDKDFLNYLYLSVEKDGEKISSGKAAAGEGLNQWADLGTLAAGESLTVKVTLNVDKGMDNDFQNYDCKIRWMFRTVTADVIPNQPNVPVATITPENVPAATPQKPQEATATLPENEEVPLTGAASWALFNLLCAIVTVILCVVLLIVYLVKKKNSEENDTADADNKDTPADYRSSTNKDTGDDDNNNEKNEDKKKLVWRILSVVIAVLAVIVFLLTEDIRLPMVWFDKWTIMMVIILVVQIADTVIVLYKKKERDKNKNEV